MVLVVGSLEPGEPVLVDPRHIRIAAEASLTNRPRNPVNYPDIPVKALAPLSHAIRVLVNGYPMDWRMHELVAPVTDNGNVVGHLDIFHEDEPGVVSLTLRSDVIEAMSHYSTWKLCERTSLNGPLVQGRYIKEIPA